MLQQHKQSAAPISKDQPLVEGPRYAGGFLFSPTPRIWRFARVACVDPTVVLSKVDAPAVNAMERAHFVCDALEACADPRTYFQLAASSRLIPPAALSEVIEAVEAYQSEPNLAFKAVVPALKRAERAMNRSVASMFRNAAPDVARYLSVAQGAISRESNPGVLSAYLAAHHSSISRAAADAAENYNANFAYISELSSMLAEVLKSSEKFTPGKKSHAVSLTRELVAAVANQGRTPEIFAASICELIRKQRNASNAASGFLKFMSEPTRRFQVVVVIDGTVRTLGLDYNLFRRVDPNQSISWTTPSVGTKRATADMDLVRFCLHHWGLKYSRSATEKHDLLAQALITTVDAWDEEQARHVALDRAEELVDKINAEHRTNHFGVKRKVMVWQEGEREAREVFPKGRTQPTTRQMSLVHAPSVNRSLRFASRAAGERAGSMQVFFAWIALEYLGRGGNKTPQNLVAEYAPYAVSLVELRHLVTLVWVQVTAHKAPASFPVEVRHAIKRGNGPLEKQHKAQAFDMRKLLALIIADGGHTDHLESVSGLTSAEAGAAIQAWVGIQSELSAFAVFQIKQVRDILRDNTRCQQHFEEVRLDADEILQRMRFVRNQTAHNAGVGSTEHLPLSDAALKVLDAVFEVLPQWKRAPHQALKDISSRWKVTRSSVTSRGIARHQAPFNPVAVLKP